MAIIIPLSQTLSNYRQTTNLDNINYILDFKFNSREQAWYLSIFTDEETPLLTSIKLIPSIDLVRKYKYKLPDGLFPNPLYLNKKNTPTDRPIGLRNLGLDYELLYFTDEVE